MGLHCSCIFLAHVLHLVKFDCVLGFHVESILSSQACTAGNKTNVSDSIQSEVAIPSIMSVFT